MYAPILIGLLLPVGVAAYASMFHLDRSRAFYPTLMIVIASTYVLFAVMGGSRQALVADTIIMGGFVALATMGHARNLWLVVIALAGHGLLDGIHGRVVANAGVPLWWPPFCLTYDLVAAGGLALLLVRRHTARNGHCKHPGGLSAECR